jgi:hypothetical protein
VNFVASNSVTCVVGQFASRIDSLVLFPDHPVVPGNACDLCDGLYVTLDCLA